MNPSSDIDMYKTDFAMRSPSSGLQRPFEPVKRVRQAAAVLVAQLVGREARLDHRHQGRPVSGRERQLGAEGEPRPVEAGLGRGEQQAAGALDRLEYVPVAVELAGRRAERDLPGAADAQLAARVDDPAPRVVAIELALARRAREQVEYALGRRLDQALVTELAAHSARSTKRSKRSNRLSQARRWASIHSPASPSVVAGPSRHSRARPTFSVSTRPASSRIPTCFLIPLRVRPDGPASWLSVAGPRPRRSRMPRRVGSESAKNVSSSVGDSAPIGALYNYEGCGGHPLDGRCRGGQVPGVTSADS